MEEREVLYEDLRHARKSRSRSAPTARIDRDNILRASLWALARAVARCR